MFCENCGTRVEDGQPFCPNCGKRMGGPAPSNAAPVNSGFGAPAPSRPVRPVSNSGGLLGKFNAMQGLEKIFFPIVCCLLIVCYFLSFIRIYDASLLTLSMSTRYPIWALLFTTLMALSIAFIILDYFDKFSFAWLWYAVVGVAFFLLALFAILWGDSGVKLTVGGWFAFVFHICLFGCSIVLMIGKMKK